MSPGSGRPAKKKPSEIGTDPVRKLELSTEDWAEVEHGIGLFNAGKFWHAHEAWELVWQRQLQDERLFFQGLIQLAAAYHHLTKKQLRNGYVNNLGKAENILRVFAPDYLGIHVAPLLEAITAGIDAAGGRGDGPPAELELRLIPKIAFRLPYDPDLSVAVKTAVAGPDFVEGVSLFNQGFHWEAHERWEEAARNAEGDARQFLEGFSQAAAGVNFLRSGKEGNARYLFCKSVDALGKFSGMSVGVDFGPLLAWMSASLKSNGSGPAIPRGALAGVPPIVLREASATS